MKSTCPKCNYLPTAIQCNDVVFICISLTNNVLNIWGCCKLKSHLEVKWFFTKQAINSPKFNCIQTPHFFFLLRVKLSYLQWCIRVWHLIAKRADQQQWTPWPRGKNINVWYGQAIAKWTTTRGYPRDGCKQLFLTNRSFITESYWPKKKSISHCVF
jgi:hypothetical protein